MSSWQYVVKVIMTETGSGNNNEIKIINNALTMMVTMTVTQ